MNELDLQILSDGDEEAEKILAKARAEAEGIMKAARQEAARVHAEILRQGRGAAADEERRISAALNLEMRNMALNTREKLLSAVMGRIRAKAAAFRTSPDYPSYLKDRILKGALAMDVLQVDVVGAVGDKGILQRSLLQEVERELAERYSKKVSFEFVPDTDFHDIGILLRSRGRPMVFDGTFEAGLHRIYEKVRRDILTLMFQQESGYA